MNAPTTEVWVLMAHVEYEGDEVYGVYVLREAGEKAALGCFVDPQFVVPFERGPNQTEWRANGQMRLQNHRDRLTLTRWDLE